MRNPLEEDLDHVLAQTGALWDELRGARVFLTGGTGFFGCWLLETFLWANDRIGLDASIVALTRDRSAFQAKVPHLACHQAVTVHDGDVRSFAFPDGAFSHVIHAATASSVAVEPRLMFDTIVCGTRRVLEFAGRSGATRFLFTSSGAVYGRQPADLTHMPEDYSGGPDPADERMVYGESKRAAEMLCAVYADQRVQPVIARCFAFVGPYLPLDAHFAVGNFIRDGLEGKPICLTGDGTPYRSYMYAADLAAWLWTILVKGETMRPYNVGSEAAVSIADVARAVAQRFDPVPPIRVTRAAVGHARAERYVPSTARVRRDLGVTVDVDFAEALGRTVNWHRGRGSSHYAGH